MDEGNITTIALFVIAQLITAAAIWGGLRADIKHIHEKMSIMADATDKSISAALKAADIKSDAALLLSRENNTRLNTFLDRHNNGK